MSRTSRAQDLAAVDAALEFVRQDTARRLARQAKEKPRRPWISKEQRRELRELRRAEVLGRRQRMAETPLPIAWSPEVQARFDGYYVEVESRLERERRHAAVREIMAAKCQEAGAYLRDFPTPERSDAPELNGRRRKKLRPLEPRDLAFMTEKLTRARTRGHWGTHRETGKVHVRYFDRSGLPLLDPSEAHRNGARLGRRLVPELQRCHAAGHLLYYAVASEPNVPAGHLAWGKRNIFRRLRRDIYDRFPEIVGVLAVQEDPLSAEHQSWNVHVNLILIVDPRRCTPLTEEVARQLDLGLRGNSILPFTPRPVPLDPTPPGCLSYAKLHRAWGPHQLHIEKLKSADAESLTRSLREIIKYSAKMVPAKSIGERTGLAARAEDRAGRDRAADRDDDARSVGVDGAADRAGPDSRSAFELGAARDAKNKARRSAHAAPPGLAEYPTGRFVEFLEANRRFRRVRTWGVLYQLAPDDLPEDPDKAGKVRFHGRVRVDSRHVFVEAARLSFISLIHGDKSGRDFHGSTGRSPSQGARAGPAGVQVAA